jgi:hypothetical protein
MLYAIAQFLVNVFAPKFEKDDEPLQILTYNYKTSRLEKKER